MRSVTCATVEFNSAISAHYIVSRPSSSMHSTAASRKLEFWMLVSTHCCSASVANSRSRSDMGSTAPGPNCSNTIRLTAPRRSPTDAAFHSTAPPSTTAPMPSMNSVTPDSSEAEMFDGSGSAQAIRNMLKASARTINPDPTKRDRRDPAATLIALARWSRRRTDKAPRRSHPTRPTIRQPTSTPRRLHPGA